jgi:hypothetical protein
MTIEKLKEYHERRPFVPFDIKVSDGRVFCVDHAGFLAQSRDGLTVLFVTEDNRDTVIDVSHITTLEVANAPGSARRVG